MIDANDRLFAQIATVIYCLWSVEPKSQWYEALGKLLKQHPTVPLQTMGFPIDWCERLKSIRNFS